MTRTALVALTIATALAVPPSVGAQTRQRSGSSAGQSSGGKATPRTGSSGGSTASGGSSPRSGPSTRSGGTRSGGDDSSRPVRATGRSGDRSGSGVQSGGSSSGSDSAVTRDRDLQPDRGRAVARRPDAGGGNGGTTVIVNNPGYWGGYYPWGYGGLGLGGYYGGFYDPWSYGGDPGYADPYAYGYTGSLRLKVKPRDAEVYVDGYFAGQVDDFDGVFQRLKLEAGPHRVEVREETFEPLMFEISIQPDRTVTYKGELKALP